MKPSRSETFNDVAASLVKGLGACMLIPALVVFLAGVRLCEVVIDSRAGRAAWEFWYGRRA